MGVAGHRRGDGGLHRARGRRAPRRRPTGARPRRPGAHPAGRRPSWSPGCRRRPPLDRRAARRRPARRARARTGAGRRTCRPAAGAARAHAERAAAWPCAGPAPTATRSTGVDLRVPAGGGLVLSGPTGSGKSTVLAALLRTLDPRAGRAAMDGVDTAGARRRRRPQPDRLVRPRIPPVRQHAAGEPAAGPAGRPRRPDRRGPRAAPASAPGSPVCPKGWTLPSGGTAAPSPAGSGSGSGLPARCSPTGRCCCSTSPPPTWTPRPPRGSATTC